MLMIILFYYLQRPLHARIPLSQSVVSVNHEDAVLNNFFDFLNQITPLLLHQISYFLDQHIPLLFEVKQNLGNICDNWLCFVGDEVLETSSESCSNECSYTESHDKSDNKLNSTSTECIDMDVNYVEDTGVIKCNFQPCPLNNKKEWKAIFQLHLCFLKDMKLNLSVILQLIYV